MSSEATLRMLLIGEDRSASKAVKGVGDTADKARGHFSSLGKVAAGVFAGGALIEGAQKATEFLKGSIEAAIQDQQNNAILEKQLRNTTGATKAQISATEDWITKTAEASGTAKTDITPSLTKLATVTGSVTKAQQLTTLAMNVAAGTHQKLTSVVSAFVKAQNGSIGGLSRLGIATKNADGTTKTFAQTQKIMAQQFKGDTAAAADTVAGRMKRLSVTWEIMKEEIGEKLLPVLAALAAFFLDKVGPAISQVAGFLSTKLGPVFGQVSGNVSHMQGSVSTDLHALESTFSGVVSIIRSLWARFGSFILTYIVATMHNVWQAIGGALKIIEGVVKVFSSLLRGDWKGVWDGIKLILAGALQLIGAIVKQALNLIKLAWHLGWSALTAILKGVWDGIIALAKLSATGLVNLIRGIPNDIKNLGGLFLSAGKSLMGKLFDGLKSVAGNAAGFASNIATGIVDDIIGVLNRILPHTLSINKGPIHVSVPLFPTIPALAAGGIVSRPTLAMIGEAGPEAVVPLSGSRGGFGGGDLGTVTLVLKGEDGRELQRRLLTLKRQNGNLALGLS